MSLITVEGNKVTQRKAPRPIANTHHVNDSTDVESTAHYEIQQHPNDDGRDDAPGGPVEEVGEEKSLLFLFFEVIVRVDYVLV